MGDIKDLFGQCSKHENNDYKRGWADCVCYIYSYYKIRKLSNNEAIDIVFFLNKNQPSLDKIGRKCNNLIENTRRKKMEIICKTAKLSDGAYDYVLPEAEDKYRVAIKKWRKDSCDVVSISEKTSKVRLDDNRIAQNNINRWKFVSAFEDSRKRKYYNDDMVGDCLEKSKWIFAKTMPENPHEYTLREEWEGKIPFNDMVQIIRDDGYYEIFRKRYYAVFYLGDYRYWTMGDPVSVTTLINRRKVNDEKLQ